MNANVKGHTLIELTDTRTGKVRRYEKDNMLTQAILKLWENPWGLNDYPFSPAQLMSGIMLFGSTQTESVSNFKLDAMPGTWAGNGTNSTVSGAYGSMNRAESEITSTGVKFVWDWTTTQGNGTYNSASLTSPLFCNDEIFGNFAVNGTYSTDPNGLYPWQARDFTNMITYNNSSYQSSTPLRFRMLMPTCTTSPMANTPFLNPFAYDAENGYLYGMTSSDGQALTFTRVKRPTSSVLLTQGWYADYAHNSPDFPIIGPVETKTINVTSPVFNTATNSTGLRCFGFCAGNTGVIYIITLSGNGTTGDTDMMVTAINFGSETVIQQHHTLDTAVRLFNSTSEGFPFNGGYPVKYPYIYVPGAGTTANWYKIDITDGTQTELTATGSAFPLVQGCEGFTHADPFYYFWTKRETGGRGGVMINTLTNTVNYDIKLPESPGKPNILFGDNEYRMAGKSIVIPCNDILNIYLRGGRKNNQNESDECAASLEYNPAYKATINNFDSPITKTEYDTMKFTYTLTQT